MRSLFAEELTLIPAGPGYEIRIGNQLFAGYITDYAGSPIVYPIVGPAGKNMTRDYPMQKNDETGKADHPHHRSLWLSHGDVNRLDFWTGKHNIVHRRFSQAACDGQTALLVTENDWVGPNNQIICRDVRTLRFFLSKDMRIIDVDVAITAEQESVLFGDTKEGTFAIRVPDAIAAETRKGGQFVNAEGQAGEKDAWGKRSAWVNYHGILDGEAAGIAVLNHPSSFRYPTYWHVRDYGLFAANPFGVNDFERLGNRRAGDYTLSKGESFSLHYRVLLHRGNADISGAFKEYAGQSR